MYQNPQGGGPPGPGPGGYYQGYPPPPIPSGSSKRSDPHKVQPYSGPSHHQVTVNSHHQVQQVHGHASHSGQVYRVVEQVAYAQPVSQPKPVYYNSGTYFDGPKLGCYAWKSTSEISLFFVSQMRNPLYPNLFALISQMLLIRAKLGSPIMAIKQGTCLNILRATVSPFKWVAPAVQTPK